jgi:hypothetical protein
MCAASARVSVRRVVLQQLVLERVDGRDVGRGQFRRQRADVVPQHGGGDGGTELARDLLRGGQRLEGHAVPLAGALFENARTLNHIARTSNFSFSTSCAAASFGSPVEQLRAFVALGQIHAVDDDARRGWSHAQAIGGEAADLLRLGLP